MRTWTEIAEASPRKQAATFGLALFTLIAAFTLLCSRQWKAPAIEDEVLHFQCKVLWYEKGAVPCEMAHTPGYHEATSLWQRIWGPASNDKVENIWILRSFGVFTAILTALVFAWGLSLLGTGGDRMSATPLPLIAILIFHPYFVQGSLLLDYDNTISMAPLLLSVICIEAWDAAKSTPGSWGWTLAASMSLAIAIFSKELTPLLLIALWPCWAFLKPHPRKWAQALIGGLLSLGLAFASLWAWGKLRGFSWDAPLAITIDKFFGRTHGQEPFVPWKKWGMARFLFLSYLPLLWVGLPTLASLAWLGNAKRLPLASQGRFTQNLKTRVREIPFSIWTALVILGAYTWLVQAGFYFPKYTSPAWPILLFGLSRLLAPAHFSRLRGKSWLLGCALLFMIGFLAFFDPLLLIENRSNLSTATLGRHALAFGLPTLVLWFLARLYPRARAAALVTGLLCYLVGFDLGQAHRDYQTRFLYGERGFDETRHQVLKLQARLAPLKPVLTVARDLFWALPGHARFVQLEDFHPHTVSWDGPVVVSRTYGEYSVRHWPRALEEVERAYPCHETSPTGGRYEWWWKPAPNERCAQSSGEIKAR